MSLLTPQPTEDAKTKHLNKLQSDLLVTPNGLLQMLARTHDGKGKDLFGYREIDGEPLTVQERLDVLGTDAAEFFQLTEQLRGFVNGLQPDTIASAVPEGGTLTLNSDGTATYSGDEPEAPQ